MSGRIQWMFVVALMLSSGLSGCFDQGKDEGDKEGWSLFQRSGGGDSDEVVPVDAYEHHLRTHDPAHCEGCIPLDRPTPQPTTAKRPEPPSVRIPFPQGGDHVRFFGDTAGHSIHDNPPVPTDQEGQYRGVLRVLHGDPDHARFQLGFTDARWDHPPHEVAAHVLDWNVSLESRTVTNGTGLGYVHTSGMLHSEARTARIQTDPKLETLFWLGAHVWGRTLTAGDDFTVHLGGAGPGDGRLDFEYEVLRVPTENRAVAHVSHGESPLSPGSATAVLRVKVTDAQRDHATWDMSFSPYSPYPLRMTARSGNHPSDGARSLPDIAHDQRLELQERGTEPIAWSETLRRPTQRDEPDDKGFILGERQASRALDILPLYPLHTALSDLALHNPSYASYISEFPDRVILEARYDSTPVGEGSLRHTWSIAFTDREGSVSGWSVSRLSTQGILAPTAHAHQQTVFRAPSEVARHLTDRSLIVRLATGSTGTDRLASWGIEVVDHMHYRLHMESTDTVGGTLRAYRHHVDAASRTIETGPEPLGYFVQDLAARTVTESGLLVRSY